MHGGHAQNVAIQQMLLLSSAYLLGRCSALVATSCKHTPSPVFLLNNSNAAWLTSDLFADLHSQPHCGLADDWRGIRSQCS
jgi:hypothetical protein